MAVNPGKFCKQFIKVNEIEILSSQKNSNLVSHVCVDSTISLIGVVGSNVGDLQLYIQSWMLSNVRFKY